MTQSIYETYLFYTKKNISIFGIVGLHTHDTLFLSDKSFAIKEEKQLYKANLLPKK